MSQATGPGLDYRVAFDLAPIGLVLSRERLMVDCNRHVLAMFGTARETLVGHSFEMLYPTHDEFERTVPNIASTCRLQSTIRRSRDSTSPIGARSNATR